jgi:hypothetical protein
MAYWLWQGPPLSNTCFSLGAAQPEFDESIEIPDSPTAQRQFREFQVSEFFKKKGEKT